MAFLFAGIVFAVLGGTILGSLLVYVPVALTVFVWAIFKIAAALVRRVYSFACGNDLVRR
jgi:F0F1-type ATP synthase assembly protein I